ncbi:MAG: gamma-glutamyltransferase [Verrucomicrobia bacterium]|nr:gamma-glutamyltransferase [Verrucomicrobiota bacterium]
MCPKVVLRDERPKAALGGAGGRKIPNAIFGVQTGYIGLGRSMEGAISAPRRHSISKCPVTRSVPAPW